MSTQSSNPSEWSVRFPSPTVPSAVKRGLSYSNTPDQQRVMDLYMPTGMVRLPGAMVIASGYPAPGLTKYFGRSAREFQSVRSWCELFAGEDVVAVAYDAINPEFDLPMVINHLQQHGSSLGIDGSRIGIFACSGNVPVALASANTSLRCAVFLYGFMLDEENGTVVSEAAKQFGFANPNARLPKDMHASALPTLIVRCGRDAFAGVNKSIDAYLTHALDGNSPVTLIDHADAPHAFDLVDDSEETHQVIRQILAFAREKLDPAFNR
jgi:dienelactone hydrolase